MSLDVILPSHSLQYEATQPATVPPAGFLQLAAVHCGPEEVIPLAPIPRETVPLALIPGVVILSMPGLDEFMSPARTLLSLVQNAVLHVDWCLSGVTYIIGCFDCNLPACPVKDLTAIPPAWRKLCFLRPFQEKPLSIKANRSAHLA